MMEMITKKRGQDIRINNDEIIGLGYLRIPYFNCRGCDNCDNKLGNDVYDCRAFVKTEDLRDYYKIKLCGSCLCAYFNGDPLEDECHNALNI
jgi:hypothetical protein